ncbi:hypothetical protein ATCC90586_001612 [Pythium insidiosum]|nr:hypothetical protein ATCC90586_001612 [Pythium insidiosum]
MHIVRDDPSLFKDAVECMTKCGSAPPLDEVGDTQLSDSPDMAIGSERNGTCVNCSMVARTNFNFPKLFSAFSLSPQQLGQTATCRFKASIEIGMPMGWAFNTSTSQCLLGDVPVNCSHVDNTTVISLDANSIGGLMARPHGMFSFYIDGVSTRSNPGRFNEQTLLKMRFASQGCIPNADVNTVQAFSLELTAPSYELKGLFTNTEMEATTPRIMSTTSVSMTFESGAVLRAGSFILLRVARDLEPAFGELIRGVNNARMRHQDNDVKLKLDVGRANLSFTIPETYAVPINNGDELSITFDNFRNPANTYSMIEKGYLSAFQGLSLAVDNSLINFYKVEREARNAARFGRRVDRLSWGRCDEPPSTELRAISVTMGHELTHAFDTKARRFDGDGNLWDWWTPAIARQSERRAARMKAELSTLVVMGTGSRMGPVTK